MARKMLKNVEKRGVHTARNGPSPPPTPAGGPVAKPEISSNSTSNLGRLVLDRAFLMILRRFIAWRWHSGMRAER